MAEVRRESTKDSARRDSSVSPKKLGEERRGSSKEVGRVDSKDSVSRRRSSLSKGVGQSLQDLDKQKEETKPQFLKQVLNPVLEACAMRYFEASDDTTSFSITYEDLVKNFIKWVQETRGLQPPLETLEEAPSKEEIAHLKAHVKELTKKLEEISRIEGQSSGTQKVTSMVRRMSNARRLSKGFAAK